MPDEPLDGHPANPDRLEELDRQLERGSLFMHASFDRIASRATGIERRLTQLIDVLAANGVLGPGDLAGPSPGPVAGSEPGGDTEAPGGPEEAGAAEEAVGGEPAAVPWPAIALRGQSVTPKPPVAVNCAERMHVCHAVCCKLHFPLSAEEVDAGRVRFDLGFPYMIRHDADGYCTHNDRTTGFCGIYADRPGVCRTYSCAGDTRIWSDFEKMELNHEWLDAHLGNAQRIRLRLDLPMMDPGQPLG
jgi:Fe-S-cluster containining protein